MKERHQFLYDSIGFHKEESEAMETVSHMVSGCTAFIFFGLYFEAYFFCLYNSKFHPFAQILDMSEEPEGKKSVKFILFMYSMITRRITAKKMK